MIRRPGQADSPPKTSKPNSPKNVQRAGRPPGPETIGLMRGRPRGDYAVRFASAETEPFWIAAWAAASRAIGTRYGEQET